MFLPHKTLDLMYKILVRSHLDYCDIIYHIPSRQTRLGVTLNALMEKTERIQYQAALAVTGAWGHGDEMFEAKFTQKKQKKYVMIGRICVGMHLSKEGLIPTSHPLATWLSWRVLYLLFAMAWAKFQCQPMCFVFS